MAPMDRRDLFRKLIGNLLFIFAVELVLLPLMTVLYNMSLLRLRFCWSYSWGP